ncbi:hypothetical protein [Glaciimonas sp. PCH181]|uniref:hypothetical protein n=1 Tax=Glaciimonas sp. PCH181 TaxID=2133943 RepID=UPI000D33418F|nr:hypothetical protein [Glaciimonas sp. PCH181]PUA18914.1 hypothetical protein C7W93_03080 [Glaciimonas sp. PCH181]
MTNKIWGGITIGGVLVAFLGLLAMQSSQSIERPGTAIGPCSTTPENNAHKNKLQGEKPHRTPELSRQLGPPVRHFMY